MTADEQLRAFQRYSGRALELALEILASRADLIVQRAHRRFTLGLDTFGDEMFRMHPSRLLVETDEELADAVNYLVAWLYQTDGAGGIAHRAG